MPNLPRRCTSAAASIRRSHKFGGFTLIELLTVIAIIGILAAIVIPTVGTVREKAQRAVDQNNLREIMKAAQIYAGDNNDRLPDPTAITQQVLNTPQLVWKWPGILAKNNILSDPTFYFSKNDPAFNGIPPAFIIAPTAARNTMDQQFITGRSPSWVFVGGVKMSDPAKTPIVFTRGLQTNGLWSPTSGVYKETGGFIAFLGGNVAFYSNTQGTNSPFYSNNPSTTSRTQPQNILQAIPFTGVAATNARLYGVPPTSGAGGMVGTPAGQVSTRGP